MAENSIIVRGSADNQHKGDKMILADKIIENRKKNGWSQEELADRLGVSRQSVSKWESTQAVPDMKKIVQLSEVFGVSIDYLMKDEIETATRTETPVDDGIEEAVQKVSMEEANAFLTHCESASKRVSTGVMLCILSPVLLILTGGLSERDSLPVDEYTAGILGLVILLSMVAAAVAMFLMEGMRGKPYEYLERVNIDTEYGVNGMVKERRNTYAERHSRLLILGIMLCVISAIPMFLLQITRYTSARLLPVIGVCILLIMVAIGVKLIVLTCMRQGGYDKLLEEGDYTRLGKKAGKYDGIYWAIATAVYLAWSFIGGRWDFTWVVWPIAGVLYAAYHEIMKAIMRSAK